MPQQRCHCVGLTHTDRARDKNVIAITQCQKFFPNFRVKLVKCGLIVKRANLVKNYLLGLLRFQRLLPVKDIRASLAPLSQIFSIPPPKSAMATLAKPLSE